MIQRKHSSFYEPNDEAQPGPMTRIPFSFSYRFIYNLINSNQRTFTAFANNAHCTSFGLFIYKTASVVRGNNLPNINRFRSYCFSHKCELFELHCTNNGAHTNPHICIQYTRCKITTCAHRMIVWPNVSAKIFHEAHRLHFCMKFATDITIGWTMQFDSVVVVCTASSNKSTDFRDEEFRYSNFFDAAIFMARFLFFLHRTIWQIGKILLRLLCADRVTQHF